jgi:hypothetical protein
VPNNEPGDDAKVTTKMKSSDDDELNDLNEDNDVEDNDVEGDVNDDGDLAYMWTRWWTWPSKKKNLQHL